MSGNQPNEPSVPKGQASVTFTEDAGFATLDYKPEKWAEFVLHLLENLDLFLDKPAAEDFLLEIHDGIQTRLDNGRW